MWPESGSNQADEYRSSPIEILPLLWRFKRLIIIVPVLTAGLAYGWSRLQEAPAQPEQYTATAKMALTYRPSGNPVQDAKVQAELAISTPALVKVSELIGGRVSASDLKHHVTAKAASDFGLVTISATDATPDGALQIADAASQAYSDQARENIQTIADAATAELEAVQADLQTAIIELDVAIVNDPDSDVLQGERDGTVSRSIELAKEIDRIAFEATLDSSGVGSFEEARLLGSPPQPQSKALRNAAIGGILGLMGAVASAWWLAERRPVADRRHDAASILRAPLLWVVPVLDSVGATTKAPAVTEPASVAEPYHFLASAMERFFDTQNQKVILVASANPGDGKTVTAMNVAVAIAGGGHKVVLVDADTRTRGLSRWLGLDDAPGLTDITRGAAVTDAMRAASDSSDDLPLRIVAVGTATHPGSGFFRSVGFRTAMTVIAEHGEAVIVDSPAILEVADASAMAGRTDGIILIVDRGTSLQDLEDTRNRLHTVETPILGYVFNSAARARSKHTGYR